MSDPLNMFDDFEVSTFPLKTTNPKKVGAGRCKRVGSIVRVDILIKDKLTWLGRMKRFFGFKVERYPEYDTLHYKIGGDIPDKYKEMNLPFLSPQTHEKD